MSSNWSARLEYLYISAKDVASSSSIPIILGQGAPSEMAGYRDNILRVGLNYRFGPRGGPGVIERQLATPASYASAYDFLPSMTTLADKAGSESRAKTAPSLADASAQRSTSALIASETGAAISGAVATEPKVATAVAMVPEAKPSKAFRSFADIDETETTDVAAAADPKMITLPSIKQRSKAGDDSDRLKRIMAICAGC